jgi:F-type H+-transporting ATPase subunit delta
VAADYQQRVLATVRTAIPLTSDEQERLSAELHRIYSRDVHLNVVVDPALLGGVRVELGDDIMDGTVVARLQDARRKMTS